MTQVSGAADIAANGHDAGWEHPRSDRLLLTLGFRGRWLRRAAPGDAPRSWLLTCATMRFGLVTRCALEHCDSKTALSSCRSVRNRLMNRTNHDT